ncbi:hypothetical protein G6F59_015267 [Rhizopus arrhizus]|nr:hypothetical protein G6F59_015267 [Rhizopus arrhizus]
MPRAQPSAAIAARRAGDGRSGDAAATAPGPAGPTAPPASSRTQTRSAGAGAPPVLHAVPAVPARWPAIPRPGRGWDSACSDPAPARADRCWVRTWPARGPAPCGPPASIRYDRCGSAGRDCRGSSGPARPGARGSRWRAPCARAGPAHPRPWRGSTRPIRRHARPPATAAGHCLRPGYG